VSTHDVDGLNAGYARALLDEYLENPDAVPSEWRALFESGESELVATHPGIARLLELLPQAQGNGAGDGDGAGNGHTAAATAEAPPAPQPLSDDSSQATPDSQLLGGIAAAMALVKAHRTHGHLAARLDPLGSEPVGDPALEPLRLEPKLTPELQARIPASYLRVHVPGETLADVLPKLSETYCSTIAYELEHLSDHQQRVWLRQAIESGRYRQALSADEKRLHLFHTVHKNGSGTAVATGEHMLLHVDTATGRVCPMEEPLAGRIGTLARLHSGLPLPDGAGRYVGQPRS